MNTKVIVMAMTLLTLVLVATGAPAIASAQYFGGDALDQSRDGFTFDELIHAKISNPSTYHAETAVLSHAPFVTLLIMGVTAGAIASTFFIKGRSGRYATVGDGSCQKSAIK